MDIESMSSIFCKYRIDIESKLKSRYRVITSLKSNQWHQWYWWVMNPDLPRSDVSRISRETPAFWSHLLLTCRVIKISRISVLSTNKVFLINKRAISKELKLYLFLINITFCYLLITPRKTPLYMESLESLADGFCHMPSLGLCQHCLSIQLCWYSDYTISPYRNVSTRQSFVIPATVRW